MSSYAPALHLREAFDPSTAALLVVDIQNYCCHRHGGLFRAQASQSLSEMGQVSGLSTEDWEYFWTRLDAVVLPNLNHLQDACRTRKLEVIFTVCGDGISYVTVPVMFRDTEISNTPN